MNTNVASATTPALRPAGRERICAQCTTTYRAPRASSLYCSPACRLRSHRGTPSTDGKALDLLRRWLLRRSYAGQIGPVNNRNPRPAVYALTVPRALALNEWNGWNPGAAMSEDEFRQKLKELHFLDANEEPRH